MVSILAVRLTNVEQTKHMIKLFCETYLEIHIKDKPYMYILKSTLNNKDDKSHITLLPVTLE